MLYLEEIEKAGPRMIYVADLRHEPESQVQDCPPDCEKGFIQRAWVLEGAFRTLSGGRVANLRRKFQDFCWDLFLSGANLRRLRKKGRATGDFMVPSFLFSMHISGLKMWHAPCKQGSIRGLPHYMAFSARRQPDTRHAPHTYYQELDDEHDHLRMPIPPGTASL